MDSMEQRVIGEVKKLAVVEEVESLDDDLSSLGIDSLVKVELVVALEDEFSISFDDSTLNVSKLKTVRDMCNLVKNTL